MLHQITNSAGNYNYNAYIYKNTFYPQHFHGNFELIYAFEGRTEITVGGIRNKLLSGELILIPPYSVHSIEVKNGKTWVGVFSEDFIPSYSAKYGVTEFSKFKCDPYIEEILVKFLFTETVPEHFLHISCLYMACGECAKNAEMLGKGENSEFVREAVMYISENIERDISLKELAAAMNYEYHYFSMLFHRAFAMNYRSFVNNCRFGKACTLLEDGKNSIAQVSEKCGFGSIRSFNRIFKALGGCTPNEYRQAFGWRLRQK